MARRVSPLSRPGYLAETATDPGPVVVIPQKTSIAIMVQVRFAGATVLHDRARINFGLSRRVDHPAAYRIEEIVPGWFAHRFDVCGPADVDALGIKELTCEASWSHGMRGLLGRLRTGSTAGN